MNNTINSANNINFTAKLNIRQIKGDKQKWKNVAKLFEQKTADYPNAKFGLVGGPNEKLLMGVLDRNNLYSWLFCIMPVETAEKLFSLPDIAIAEKLKNIFKFLKFKECIIFNAEKFAAQNGFYSSKAPEKIDEKLMELVYKLIEANKTRYLDKDSLFKNSLKFL